jgi:hypothetical protein
MNTVLTQATTGAEEYGYLYSDSESDCNDDSSSDSNDDSSSGLSILLLFAARG